MKSALATSTPPSMPTGLLKILDALPVDRRPKLVRGDNVFGNNAMMMALENRQQPYLFELNPQHHQDQAKVKGKSCLC